MSGFMYVFQNYIWVPIISAIIGTVLGWGGPKVIIYFQRKREKRVQLKKLRILFSKFYVSNCNSFNN